MGFCCTDRLGGVLYCLPGVSDLMGKFSEHRAGSGPSGSPPVPLGCPGCHRDGHDHEGKTCPPPKAHVDPVAQKYNSDPDIVCVVRCRNTLETHYHNDTKGNDMEFRRTDRGFGRWEFTDRYDAECSLQKSSLASEDAIWLGVNDTNPIIMASDALKLGRPDLTGGQTKGWVDWLVPKEVQMTTRMHLTREQVADLLPILQHFVETGEIPDE